MAVKKRKKTDTWKKKEKYTIYSPKSFEEKAVGITVADDEKKLIGRIYRCPLKEITNNLSHQFVKLTLRIKEVKGKSAYTQLEGFELSEEYLRRNVRRRRSMVKLVKNAETKDGKKIRVTVYTFTARRIETSKKSAIRKIMEEFVENKAKEENFDAFIQKCVFGTYAGELFKEVKKIVPIKRIEFGKCKLISGRQ